MPQLKSNGITLAYAVSGPANGPPLLLIHGLGAQLIQWPAAWCEAFAAAGFRVIRFDNRDVGLSTHLTNAPIPDIPEVIAAQKRGEAFPLPYTVADMARDAAGLLSGLGIKQAHIFGASLGGMIAQELALEFPQHVRSLTIMMSHTGNPGLPDSDPKVMAVLTSVPPNPFEDEQGFRQYARTLARAIGSPGYPVEDASAEMFFLNAARRSYDPVGVGRQLAASRGALDRRHRLKHLKMPTLIIHGDVDPIIPIAGGQDLFDHIEGALMLTIRGLGHDLPPQLSDIIVSAVAANERRG